YFSRYVPGARQQPDAGVDGVSFDHVLHVVHDGGAVQVRGAGHETRVAEQRDDGPLGRCRRLSIVDERPAKAPPGGGRGSQAGTARGHWISFRRRTEKTVGRGTYRGGARPISEA